MNSARWQEVQRVFWEARALEEEARDQYIRAACGDDVDMLRQVQRMLEAERTTGILDRTPELFTQLNQLFDQPIDDRAGPYQLHDEIGRGGMGIVYRAYDPRLRREVALKFLSSDLGDAEAQARFIKEARTASALDHPHNCPVYDIGKTERGRLFIAMAYCSRGSLARRLASGPLPVKEAVRIAIEVADLLEAAHQAGVIHRDIKPANIAFSERGDARVLDFGVAVFGADDVAATSPAGTIAYMSPEQLRGQPADGRSDIYSLGVVLYEMLTGQRPFTGERADLRAAILNDEPRSVRELRPEVPATLARVVARALAKDPAERFATARDFQVALKAVSEQRAQRRFKYAAAAIGALLLATSGYLATRNRTPALAPDGGQNTVVVLPFRVSSEPGLAYLREGMMDLLAAKLTGEGGLRAADPRTVLAAAGESLATQDLASTAALQLARKLDANHVLLGNVVGNAQNLVLSATLLDATGRIVGTTSVEGSHSDLARLVDQMVAELLSESAGEDHQRLSSLTSTSLPALRAYLEGQSAYRRGQFRAAVEKYNQAIDLDSTFALAGLAIHMADGWIGTGIGERGLRIAWQSRERLSPRDRALLESAVGSTYPRAPTITDRLDATERALRLAPDRPELWYTLGDLHFHWGRLFGSGDWEARAERAFRQALQLDSAYTPAAQHLFILLARQARRAEAETLANRMLARDPEGATAEYVRWRLNPVVQLRPPEPLFLDTLSTEALGWIAMTSFDEGIALRVGRRALHTRSLRPGNRAERLERLLSLHANALNAGRPGEALAVTSLLREVQPDSGFYLRLRVLGALYGDGQKAAAEHAADSLLQLQERAANNLALNRCVVALLRPNVNVPAVDDPPLPLRACSAILRAMRVQPNTREWQQHVAALDELLRSGPLGFYAGDGYVDAVPIALARILEAAGETQDALSALRRRPYFIGWHPFLAHSLLAEARLAERLGDQASAERAYRHYLALRGSADPPLRALTDSLRNRLR